MYLLKNIYFLDFFVKKGDMTFMKEEFKEKWIHSHSTSRSKRLALKSANLWEDGVVPYAFSSLYTGNG